MNRQPVTSSQLHAVGYDPKTQTLEIEFKAYKGANPVYEYKGVTPETYSALMAAPSKGKYFGAHIKGVNRYTKVG